jgi:hypothetical protein
MSAGPMQSATQLDDATIAYIFDMGPPFEGLRQVASLLSGFLVLVAAGARTSVSQYPVLSVASDRYQAAIGQVQSARAPRRALHHHHHLLSAGLLLGNALTRSLVTRESVMDVRTILTPLERGWTQLRVASRTLPGFEVVTMDGACCAEHGGRLDDLRVASDTGNRGIE